MYRLETAQLCPVFLLQSIFTLFTRQFLFHRVNNLIHLLDVWSKNFGKLFVFSVFVTFYLKFLIIFSMYNKQICIKFAQLFPIFLLQCFFSLFMEQLFYKANNITAITVWSKNYVEIAVPSVFFSAFFLLNIWFYKKKVFAENFWSFIFNIFFN